MRNNSVRLVYTFFAALVFYSVAPSCSKSPTPTTRRPTNTVTVINNIKYGSNTDWQGNTEDLLLDVYIPPGVTGTEKFPLIVYVHGGGFVDGDKEDKRTMMTDFANSGFVSASINYRLGWNQGTGCDGDTTQAKEAVYRAVQDARSAIRFLVSNAGTYFIDTTNIFLGGESAGAITVLSTNYFTQAYANELIPGIQAKLGAIDFADNDARIHYSIKGIASVAGCLNSPDLITTANVKPTIYMHGMMDNVIPYDTGHDYNCKNFSFCYGDYYLYNASKDIAPCVMHLDSTGVHNVYDEPFIKTNEVCFFKSILKNNINTGFYTGTESSCQ